MLVKVCNQVVQAIPLNSKQAGYQERRIIPVDNNDFRYLRFRAIGNFEVSASNGNWDGFPYEDFEDETPGYGYKSFINKKAHWEHNSHSGLMGSIGDLPDAYLNRFIYPSDITEKRWSSLLGRKNDAIRYAILSAPNQTAGDIEVLMRIDTKLMKSASTDPKVKSALERIVRMIDTGQKLTCSMGANIEHSHCSICGNNARFSSEYCAHLKKRKGHLVIIPANDFRDMLDKEILRPEWIKHIAASKFDVDEILKGSSNKGVASRIQEINHKASFFELSIVSIPAFTEAWQLEKLARKQNEAKKEYLERMAKEFGTDSIFDLYSFLQERGMISSQCQVQ